MIPGTRFPPCRLCARPIHCDSGETRTRCRVCEGLPCPPELQGNVYPRYEARETAEGAVVGTVAEGDVRGSSAAGDGVAEEWSEGMISIMEHRIVKCDCGRVVHQGERAEEDALTVTVRNACQECQEANGVQISERRCHRCGETGPHIPKAGDIDAYVCLTCWRSYSMKWA